MSDPSMWTGWMQRTPGGSWEAVCKGRTLPACAARLRQIAERLHIPHSRTVLTGGGQPLAPAARQVKLVKRRPQ
jgi:hypothetical protein